MGVSRMRERKNSTPVIVQTAHGSIEAVISAMRAGYDFVVKPVSRAPGTFRSRTHCAPMRSGREIAINRRATAYLTFSDLVFAGEEMTRVVRLGERAKSTIPVLRRQIRASAGAGWRAIQGGSDRKGQAVRDRQLRRRAAREPRRSILFGHEKGAIHRRRRPPRRQFQEANGGHAVLDEIGELPLETGGKTLRALREGEIDPIGQASGARRHPADLGDQPEPHRTGEGRKIPRGSITGSTFPDHPFRRCARGRGDIGDLAAALLHASRPRRQEDRGVTAEALALSAYDWPGNVRQLENALFRAIVLADGDELYRRGISADRRAGRRV